MMSFIGVKLLCVELIVIRMVSLLNMNLFVFIMILGMMVFIVSGGFLFSINVG